MRPAARLGATAAMLIVGTLTFSTREALAQNPVVPYPMPAAPVYNNYGGYGYSESSPVYSRNYYYNQPRYYSGWYRNFGRTYRYTEVQQGYGRSRRGWLTVR